MGGAEEFKIEVEEVHQSRELHVVPFGTRDSNEYKKRKLPARVHDYTRVTQTFQTIPDNWLSYMMQLYAGRAQPRKTNLREKNLH